jgi:hypothetical protein
MQNIFTLLIVYQIKHYLADFPLQVNYMIGKTKTGLAWVLPLAAHCAVHGGLTFLILVLWSRLDLWWLALVDFGIHFLMDRTKASPHLLGRFKPQEHYYWWVLGFDQMVHHLTHYFVIWNLVK